ncbi:sporulation integral membrane protein YlbJ [Paenibacillus sp. 1P07SE]|uniref:sporulation integral membrane protein YlbJ n=1 Tax=Paenibacillus sp. 1P07SE TaxID=3132209 RepID=UPI0039A4849B
MLRRLCSPVVLSAMIACILTLLMTLYTEAALSASIRGISIWWEVLFPSLFTFFVLSEVLLGFGVVHFFGTLLDPLMRPVFRIPGIGGFVLTMGLVAGYPVGARLTAQLREQGLVNRSEGERLVAFTTSSDPIFLIGAVSVGFFHNVAVAPLLAAAHYGSVMLVGVAMRFHDRHAPTTPPPEGQQTDTGRLRASLTAMHQARLADGRELGTLLRDAIQSALRLMLVVGGLVVFFSVMMEVLTQAGILPRFADAIEALMRLLGLPSALADAIVSGLFEVTLGSREAGLAGGGLIHQLAIAAWILSWGGLSVHAQIASLIGSTGMRYGPFLIARLLHSILAVLLVYLLWGWLGPV